MKRMRWFLLAAFSFFPLTFPAEARQLSDLRSDTRLLVRDTGAARRRYSNTQIDALLNEGQRVMAARSWCIYKSTSFSLLANTTYYPTKTDFIAVRRITRDDIEIPEMSPAALDGRSRGWETATGTPIHYFVNFASRSKVGVVPYPDQSSGTIKMDYFAYPLDMSADADEPFEAINELDGYHHALPYFAASRLTALDGRLDIAAFYLQVFELLLKEMDDKCDARPNYLPSAIGAR